MADSIWAKISSAGSSTSSATEADLLDYLDSFDDHAGARGGATRAFRSFYSWAAEGERILANPARRIRSKKPKEGPAPYLSREGLARLLVAAAWREERRGWTILFLAYTGLRLESAVGVRPEDVIETPNGLVLFVRVAKGDKPYSIPPRPGGPAGGSRPAPSGAPGQGWTEHPGNPARCRRRCRVGMGPPGRDRRGLPGAPSSSQALLC
jgi:hypothetical protein